jgi:hypothetical protein
MKKLIVVLVLLFAATVVFGQSIQLGRFPAAKFLDSNYDAIWEFTANNIRILDSNTGELYYDFSGMTQDFAVSVEGMTPVIKFACADAGRSYTFKANLSTDEVAMEIDRSGLPRYTVTMKKQ